jgi:hypothetical protein
MGATEYCGLSCSLTGQVSDIGDGTLEATHMSGGSTSGPVDGTTAVANRQDVRSIAEEIVDAKINKWKLAVAWFLAGFGIFIILGATWSDFRYFIIEKAYPREVAYEKLKESLLKDSGMRREVANDLLTLLGDRVDSGYSKTFYFSGGSDQQLGQDLLQFYALPRQVVEITIIAQSSATSTFIVTVDNRNLFEIEGKPNPSFPYKVAGRDISKYLTFDGPTQLDEDAEFKQKLEFIHTVRVYPLSLPVKSQATFEVLVLVRNKSV